MKKLAYLSLLSHCTVALKHCLLFSIPDALCGPEKNTERQLANNQIVPLQDSN